MTGSIRDVAHRTGRAALCVATACLMLPALPTARPSPQAASISGRVVAAGLSPTPIRRAMVTLSGAALSGTLSTVTDDDGRFAFANIPAGRYDVAASKPAHLTMAFGARQAGEDGTPVVVGDDGDVTGLEIPLPRGGVIAGTVRDPSGLPLADMVVSVARARPEGGWDDIPAPQGTAYTDDRGEYRAYGLEPGEYVVLVAPRATESRFTARPAPDVERLLRALAQGRREDAGSGQTEPAAVAFVPLYYPGTPDPASAARVTLAAGQVRDGIDVALQLIRGMEIRGQVRRGDGQSLGSIQLSLESSGPALPSGTVSPRLWPRPGPDGEFSFTHVAPGRHVIFARQRAIGDEPALWATAEVIISGADVSGLTLTLRPGLAIEGRLVFDGARTPPIDLSTARVGLVRTPASPDVVSASFTDAPVPPAATPDANGRFAIEGVLPGVYRVSSVVPGADDWWLASVMQDDVDLLDHPLSLTENAGNVTGLVATFTQRRAHLSGRLMTGDAPAPGYVVVLFPTDRSYWRRGARRIRSARPATDGSYEFRDLPAGDYHIAALTDVDTGALDDPAFLDLLVPASVPITILDGQPTVRDFRIGG